MLALAAAGVATQATAAPTSPTLSVMTYNVEGLPWPVRTGRDQDLGAIADRLAAMRRSRQQPHVIVLQEAFSAAAKDIARRAGYTFVAIGPDRNLAGAPSTKPADDDFVAAGSMFDGEGIGKWVDSGLMIASDYPITAIRRMAYPSFACAGYDCLANKGVLLVDVKVPGIATPVTIVATHLNSRSAAHVSQARSLHAYRRQIDALTRFLRVNLAANQPVIVAGDFNVGRRSDRQSYFVSSALRWRAPEILKPALQTCKISVLDCSRDDLQDLAWSEHRARDWQIFGSGSRARLQLVAMSAPFGHRPKGQMLSDHVGYTASFAITEVRPADLLIAAR